MRNGIHALANADFSREMDYAVDTIKRFGECIGITNIAMDGFAIGDSLAFSAVNLRNEAVKNAHACS